MGVSPLSRKLRNTLVDSVAAADPRLQTARRTDLTRRQTAFTKNAQRYWESSWATSWIWRARNRILSWREHNSGMADQVLAARHDPVVRAEIEALFDTHFTGLVGRLEAGSAAAAGLLASYAQPGVEQGPKAQEFITKIKTSWWHRFLRGRERVGKQHPYAIRLAEALVIYPGMYALGHGLSPGLILFSFYHAWEFPHILAALDHKIPLGQEAQQADNESKAGMSGKRTWGHLKRFLARVALVAPAWALRYVMLLEVELNVTDDAADWDWERVLDGTETALEGTAWLAGVEYYIQSHARFQDRYWLTTARSLLWSLFFTFFA